MRRRKPSVTHWYVTRTALPRQRICRMAFILCIRLLDGTGVSWWKILTCSSAKTARPTATLSTTPILRAISKSLRKTWKQARLSPMRAQASRFTTRTGSLWRWRSLIPKWQRLTRSILPQTESLLRRRLWNTARDILLLRCKPHTAMSSTPSQFILTWSRKIPRKKAASPLSRWNAPTWHRKGKSR